MKKKKTLHKFYALVKNEIFMLKIQSGYYLSVFIILFGIAFYTFFVNGFFSFNQNVNLKNFFSGFPFILIAVVPALTFNCLKKDSVQEGLAIDESVKILAKFFAILFVYLFSILCTAVIPICFLRFGTFDFAQFFVGYIFIVIYGSLLISYSIFIHFSIKNKIANLIILLTSLFIFNTSHVLLRFQSNFNTFFYSLIKLFSFSIHFEDASKGIFNTADFFYYLILACLMLFITVLTCRNKIGININSKKDIFTLCFLLLFLADTNFFYKKIDFTYNKEFTLSKQSIQIAKNILEPTNITFAYSKALKNHFPQINEIREIMLKYAEANNKINIYFEDTDTNKNLQKKLNSLNIRPREIPEITSNSKSYFSSIIIENENNVFTIPFILSTDGLEFLITSKLQQLESDRKITIILIKKNDLSLDSDYAFLTKIMENYGIETYIEPEITQLAGFPIDIPIMLIGCKSITREECFYLEEEFSKGRNFFIMTNSNQIDTINSWQVLNSENKNNELLKMLEQWGIIISSELVLDTSCFELPMMAPESQEQTKINYPFWIKTTNKNYFWPSKIDFSDYLSQLNNTGKCKIEILDTTSKEGYTKNPNKLNTNPFNKENLKVTYDTIGTYVLNAKLEGEFPLLYHQGKSRNNKIFIISDQYFNCSLIAYTGNFENLNFSVDAILELNKKEYLIDIKNKTQKDFSFTKIHSKEEFDSCKKITLILCLFVFPFAITFTLVLTNFILRKRKNK
ncbi:MAG: Gldg family protein [Treponemataceae bacterium]